MIAAGLARIAGKTFWLVAFGLTWVGDLANPFLAASRWCEDCAREWDPRLWDRDADDRSETEERRP